MQHNKTTKVITHKYPVGTRVMVVEPGYTYPSFTTLFKKHGLRNTEHNPSFLRGATAVITAVDMHPSPVSNKDVLLYVLTAYNDSNECIGECIVSELAIAKAPVLAGDSNTITFREVVSLHPSSQCRWDRKNSTLHINGQSLSVRNAIRGLGSEDYTVLRIHNHETGGYGDFWYLTSTDEIAQFEGLGVDVNMKFYCDEETFAHKTRNIVI